MRGQKIVRIFVCGKSLHLLLEGLADCCCPMGQINTTPSKFDQEGCVRDWWEVLRNGRLALGSKFSAQGEWKEGVPQNACKITTKNPCPFSSSYRTFSNCKVLSQRVLLLITPTVIGNAKCPVGAGAGRMHSNDRPKWGLHAKNVH